MPAFSEGERLPTVFPWSTSLAKCCSGRERAGLCWRIARNEDPSLRLRVAQDDAFWFSSHHVSCLRVSSPRVYSLRVSRPRVAQRWRVALLVESVRLDADVFFAGGFLLLVLRDPVFPVFAGGAVFAELQTGDLGIGDG